MRRSHLRRRSGRSRRLLHAISVAIVVAASVPAVASASWGWQGVLPSGANGACPFYSPQGTCSPSAAWYQNNVADQGGDTVHAGFENGSAIRGIYLGQYNSTTLYESNYFSAGASVRGEMTWCVSSSYCSLGYSGVWFQVS